MPKQIFVNLPIADMQKSQAFFKSLGFSFNPQFTNDQGACMVVSDDIYVMLLVTDFFQTFTGKPVADANKSTEVLIALSCDSRAEVDDLVARTPGVVKTVRALLPAGFPMYVADAILDGLQQAADKLAA